MTVPTLKRLMVKNPTFFKVDNPELDQFNQDKDRVIVRENDGWVLKLHTAGDTYPVYRIEPNMELTYIRHGW